MSAPTPAAVRAAFAKADEDALTTEQIEMLLPYSRYTTETGSAIALNILRDHIRAIAQEMRAEADEYTKLAQGSVYELAEFRLRTAKTLGRFADKLEGKTCN